MGYKEQLKRCPCCNSEADIDTHVEIRDIHGVPRHGITVYCTVCELNITQFYSDVPDLCPEQLIDLWNTRSHVSDLEMLLKRFATKYPEDSLSSHVKRITSNNFTRS